MNTEPQRPAPDEIPRRIRVDLMTPAELAICAAMQEVEKAGADVRLTNAVILLAEAREHVADFVDGSDMRPLAQYQLNELREAISPGRIANQKYYVGVATRMRERELQIKPLEGAPYSTPHDAQQAHIDRLTRERDEAREKFRLAFPYICKTDLFYEEGKELLKSWGLLDGPRQRGEEGTDGTV